MYLTTLQKRQRLTNPSTKLQESAVVYEAFTLDFYASQSLQWCA